MTDKHPSTTRRTLACMLIAAFVANAPRAGHAAPVKIGPVSTPAAEAVALFEEGTVLEREGDKKAAADRYRAAAEANIAALDALDRSSADYLKFAQTLAKRVIKAYSAGLMVADDPAVRAAAWGWCTRMKATFDNADPPGFAEIQEACAQWQPAPPVIDEERPPLRLSRQEIHKPKVPSPNLRPLQIGLGISAALTGLLLTTSVVALSHTDRSQRLDVGIWMGLLMAAGALSTSLLGVELHRTKRLQDKLRLTASWQPGAFGLVAHGRF